jgi:type I restriction enzyme R subunit
MARSLCGPRSKNDRRDQDEGVLNLDDANVLKIAPFSAMGSVVQLINAFGGRGGFEKAVHELQDALYQETA